MADHSRSSSGSDQSYHSAAGDEDNWVHSKNIGTGGFGVVKLFINQATGEMVVLKECRLMSLSREIMERWYGELEILKRLDHPNIVKALNVPEGLNCLPMGNTPFICMEYCDGGDLRQVLRDPENCCGLPEKTIRQICRDINAGIRFLHSQRVIHRDLKPENILIMKTGPDQVVYKLTDFGYAKSYDQSSVCTSLVGTVQYVAPEVLKDKKYNSSVDFWSFGMVVFECITGKRPFLHGDPSVAIGWVEWVSKKGSKDIHVFWGENEFKPEYSSKLPQPHRLSKPFEDRITSWLQVALQFNPDMRGGRRTGTEDAPCLTNMDHILSTQVVNAVCTSTGDVNSYVISNGSTTIDALRQNIQCSTSVPPSQQYLVLSSGRMPYPTDPASTCIQEGNWNLGEVYVFTTALEPSFKMMHNTSQAVSTLTAYGDEQIQREDRRDVYSQVFFHIREQYSLFDRLHCAHRAILTQITRLCSELNHERELIPDTSRVETLATFIQEMHVADCNKMREMHSERRVLPPAVISRTLAVWDSDHKQLQEKTQYLHSIHGEVASAKQETDTLLQLSRDLQTSHAENQQRFQDYYQQYVVKAREIYQDTKLNRGYSTVGRMQDVLLGAMQDAETIIRERLNGLDFGRQFVALQNHLRLLSNKRSSVLSAKREIMEINEKRRKDLWELLQHERKSTPFSSLTDFTTDPAMQSVNPEIVEFARQFSKQSSNGSREGRGSGYQRTESRQSTSSGSHRMSGQRSSVESSLDEAALGDSLRRLQRCVSQEENDKVLQKNTQLLERLSSLVEGNGRSVIMEDVEGGDGEGGGVVNGGDRRVTESAFSQHSALTSERANLSHHLHPSMLGTPLQ